MPTIELESPAERSVVRMYQRGRLLRFLNADIFLGRHRFFNELAATLHAVEEGIPVEMSRGLVACVYTAPCIGIILFRLNRLTVPICRSGFTNKAP